MWLVLSLLACNKDVAEVEWPELVAGAPVVGAAEGTLDLPVGSPMGGFSARSHYLGAQSKQDNRASPYTVGFVESTGIHTRPGIKVVWLTNGDQDLVMTATDTIYSNDLLVEEVTKRLESRTGRALDGRVTHTANHSHHSYGPFSDQVHFYLGGDKFNREIFERFVEEVVEVAMEAYEKREEAAIGTSWSFDWDPDDRVYRDRRGDNNELVMFDDLPPGAWGKDPWLNIIRADALDGRPLAMIYTFPIHGITLSEDQSLLSSDASGGISDALEEEFDSEVVVMHLQSSGGDASPGGSDDEYARVESLGEYAREPIMAAWEATPTSSDPIFVESASRHIWQHREQIRITRDGAVDWHYPEFKYGYTSDEVVYGADGKPDPTWDEFNAEFGAAFCGSEDPLIPAGFIGSTTYPYSSCTDVGLISRVVKAIFALSDEELPLPFPESMKAGTLAARVGPLPTLILPEGQEVEEDLFAGFFPAEPTMMYGEQWRRRAKAELGFEHAMIVGYSQDHEGYFLPPEDWLMGGYEPNIAIWGPLQAEHVMEGVLAYSEDVLLTQDVKEDEDPLGYYAPTEYPLHTAMPTAFQPDLTPDAGTRITTWDFEDEEAYLWTPEGIPLDVDGEAAVPRVQGLAQLVWKGGDAMVDLPRVVLERQEGEAWVEVTLKSGRPLTDEFTDILTGWTPTPLYPAESEQEHLWWAGWQAVSHMTDKAGFPEGTYRLHVYGKKYLGGDQSWPWTTGDYEVIGDPFVVVPAEITLEADATGVWASIDAHEWAWRLVDLQGHSKGRNPVRGDVTVMISTASGDSTVTVAADTIADGRAHVPVDLTGATSVTVTDSYGNTGTLAF
jgi:hypothetical protein